MTYGSQPIRCLSPSEQPITDVATIHLSSRSEARRSRLGEGTVLRGEEIARPHNFSRTRTIKKLQVGNNRKNAKATETQQQNLYEKLQPTLSLLVAIALGTTA